MLERYYLILLDGLVTKTFYEIQQLAKVFIWSIIRETCTTYRGVCTDILNDALDIILIYEISKHWIWIHLKCKQSIQNKCTLVKLVAISYKDW